VNGGESKTKSGKKKLNVRARCEYMIGERGSQGYGSRWGIDVGDVELSASKEGRRWVQLWWRFGRCGRNLESRRSQLAWINKPDRWLVVFVCCYPMWHEQHLLFDAPYKLLLPWGRQTFFLNRARSKASLGVRGKVAKGSWWHLHHTTNCICLWVVHHLNLRSSHLLD
jgi:hypothetical protein